MKVYPLVSIDYQQAKEKQFKLVDAICGHFSGSEFLTMGDLGLSPGINQPITTRQVEKVLADFFDAPAAALVRGAGTGALRSALFSMIMPQGKILVHKAPIYPTTKVNIEAMGLQIIEADFNNLTSLNQVLKNEKIDLCLIQHTRQKPDDSYQLNDIITTLNKYHIQTLIDDNYAVMKVHQIGSEMGATLSTFSSFKLFGPQGVGVVIGNKIIIDAIKKSNYSGGCQVQGHEALEVLRGLTFAPVLHAVQSEVNEQLLKALNSGDLHFVKNAFLANAQSKVLLVELKENIAAEMIIQAEKLGALSYPVGAESKHELPPLFYRVSGTFLASDPTLKDRMIRINPNRSGAATILRILNESYQAVC